VKSVESVAFLFFCEFNWLLWIQTNQMLKDY
jgi:hypothetical protein